MYIAIDNRRADRRRPLLYKVSSICVGQTRDRNEHHPRPEAAERRLPLGALDFRALRTADTFVRRLLRKTPSCRLPKIKYPRGTWHPPDYETKAKTYSECS